MWRRGRAAVRRFRSDVRLLVAGLAVVGIGTGLALDHVGFLADQPLTGNVVAGILGAPATVLLALLVFHRLEREQHTRDWLAARGGNLRRVVTPQLDAVLTTLHVTWPLEAGDGFDTALTGLLGAYADLARRPVGRTPDDPVDPELLAATRHVAELADRRDPEATRAAVAAMVATLDLMTNQAEAPGLAEAAVDLRAVATAYADEVAEEGYRSRMFTAAMHAVAFRDWQWRDTGKYFVVRSGTTEVTHGAGLISSYGFFYQRQFRQARQLARAVRAVRELIGDTEGE